jgi:hypothetical protein
MKSLLMVACIGLLSVGLTGCGRELPKDGKDGRDGAAGKDGINGAPGKDGTVFRIVEKTGSANCEADETVASALCIPIGSKGLSSLPIFQPPAAGSGAIVISCPRMTTRLVCTK